MRNLRLWKRCAILISAAGLLAGCTEVSPEFSAFLGAIQYESPRVTARKKLMRERLGFLKKIKAGLKAGDKKAMLAAARALTANARKTPAVFAVKDLLGKTRAKANIWQKKTEFDQIAANLALSAEVFSLAVEGGDKQGMQNGFKTIVGNCGKCHGAFRAKKKKK